MADERDAMTELIELIADPIGYALDSVWNASLGATSSPDFYDAEGNLKEDAYLRYKVNVLRGAHNRIRNLATYRFMSIESN